MPILPPLRNDLKIDASTTWFEGQEAFLLIDQLRAAYYRISHKTLIILQHWDQIDPDALLEKLHALQHNEITREDINEVLQFLIQQQLIEAKSLETIDTLTQLKKTKRLHWFHWIIYHYLFFQVPLFKPQRFLERTLPWISKLFNRTYLILMVFIFILGFYLTLQNWQAFFQPLDQLISMQGIIYLIVGMAIVKCLHELGHAYATTYFGCKVYSIGVAFIVLFPILYTDSSDAWRLHNPRKRILIDCAGIISEIHTMTWFLLIWHLTDSAVIKNVITYAITYGLISTLIINLNPLMRFDGYYAFSNFLNIDNLQMRSFALARWYLRCKLIGISDPPPFKLPRKKQKIMIIYAFFTWIYRFFLFLGIAALVYFMFFKLLGILLFFLEIFYFILAPILRELIIYTKDIKKLRINKNIILTSFFLAAFISILIIPWRTTLVVPAMLVFEKKKDIYTDLNCYAEEIPFENLSSVKSQTKIFQCGSPDLDMQKQILNLKIKAIELKIVQQQGLGQKLGPSQADQSELKALKNQLQNFLAEEQRLSIYAPFTGFIFNRPPNITNHRWYAENSYLMSVAMPNDWVVKAYVSEVELNRMHTINHPIFLSNSPSTPPLPLELLAIPYARATKLENPYLASIYGGTISIIPPTEKNGPLNLKSSEFLFVFKSKYNKELRYEQRGVVVMDVEHQSLIKRLYLHIVAIFVRESTF